MLEYKSIAELVEAAKSAGKKISEVVLSDQEEQLELGREELYRRMDERLSVMEDSVRAGMNPELRSTSGLTGGDAAKMFDYASHGGICGGFVNRAIARALAMEPEILLFDEPTSALDPQMVGEVLEVMRTLAKDGLTMIIVTHEMAFARDVAKHVIFMGNGVIVEEGTSQQIFEDPQNEMTKEFLSRFRNA